MTKIRVKGNRLVRYFDTNNPVTIALVERALKARERGGYITYKNKPICVTALSYKRHLGTVHVRVEYEPAISTQRLTRPLQG